jgi:hypothetical protein
MREETGWLNEIGLAGIQPADYQTFTTKQKRSPDSLMVA